MLRGDVAEDDSSSCAVFTASHMPAAKVLDAISSLSGCAGEASDPEMLVSSGSWTRDA